MSDPRGPGSDEPTGVRGLLRGAGYAARGLRMWATAPRLMLMGAIPGLIVSVIVLSGFVVLLATVDGLARNLTPFAESWGDPWTTGVRIVVSAGIVAAAVLIAVATFTALTLAIGDPFYERISRDVDRRLGVRLAEQDTGFWSGVWRAVRDGIALVASSVAVALVVLLVGLVPVVGAPLAATLGALLGGRLLSVELTGYAFDGRGYSLRERRRRLTRVRAQSVGFGAVVYLAFLVPFGAVVMMPAAVAGATLFAADLTRPRPAVAPGGSPAPRTAAD